MPGFPFTTPTSVDEHWRNILHDLGAVSEFISVPTTMHDILIALDNGVYQMNAGVFGTGSDGKQVFDGTTTILGLAPSSSVYTLTRDIYLGDQSSISAGAVISTAGFRIFCQGGLLVNGIIRSNGNAAVANAAGATLSYSGTISNTTVGTAGGAGGTGAGAAGTNGAANGLGGAGGVGGSAGATAGGAGGTVTAPVATVTQPTSLSLAVQARILGTTALALPVGGSGGGAGGGDGTNNSGGGGGGGGIVVVVAQRLQGNTGTIQANGGVGGAANATGNSAGGAGGGGGLVIVVSRSVQPVAVNSAGPTVSGYTITAAGGAGGAGTGTGTVGGAGVAGTTILLPA